LGAKAPAGDRGRARVAKVWRVNSRRETNNVSPRDRRYFGALGMWLSMVITEVLFEFAGSDATCLSAAARFHYNVDKFGELPILFAVLIVLDESYKCWDSSRLPRRRRARSRS
jgi:hypothetical protein